jgi:two-component system, OmpR family, phosphate regulon sensor histidine kinase PhoR
MDFGGITNNPRVHYTFRVIGLVASIFLGIYFLFAAQGSASFRYDVGKTALFVFGIAWLIAGVAQFVLGKPTNRNAGIRLLIYHVMGFIFLAFFDGITSPLAGLWIVLAVITYGFFGLVALAANLVTLFWIALVDTGLHLVDYASGQNIIGENLLAYITLNLTIATVILLIRFQERDEQEFEATRKEERIQRERTLTLINNLADAILSVDANGVVQVYNAACLNLFDTNDNLYGKRIDEIIRLYNKENEVVRLIDLLQKADRGINTDDTLAFHNEDEQIRLGITYSAIRKSYTDNEPAAGEDGYIVIMRDITKSKSLEEERDEFISVVSHELRTPIAIAEGTISNAMVMFDRDDIHDDLLKEGLNAAHNQVIFLAKMVNDLSTLSRAERGVADDPEDIDINELVHNLVNEYSPEAEKKGLHLNLDTKGKLGTVSTSRLYLHELLQNFITNAIKYTKEGNVTLGAIVEGSEIVLTVSDTGIGISKAEQEKVFEKFYRSEDYRTRETGGTGLGLYVAAKLARKMGARIELKSRLNHGSTFSIRLPLKQSTPNDQQ